ncbi:MAG TPA: T9SS C-terminal target domain-containing protein [Saprospiraceae bacterium]|nr:T9SS C-terminal target domain-containing protein [Saprospiraceae bacterium]
MKKSFFFILLFAVFGLQLHAQNAPFNIYLEPLDIPNLGGLQAYAFGQHNGKWLVLGGRLDGLHRRQPFATFDIAGHNNQILVIDPVAQQKWSAPLTSLPVPLQEQLSSTNMEFIQQGDMLYVAGGYGYSNTAGDHITYNKLTAVNVPAVIDAVINGTGVSAYFRQITDDQFAVTGGHLSKIYDSYYLVGGQKFIGRYNPMGPAHGPGFIQEYTDQVRRFRIDDDGTNLSVTHLQAWTDTDQLHRRDYNVAPQIMPNGQEGITAFSGVFQKTVDLPYLNCVNIDSSGYVVNNAFSQHYNHYHCAFLPLYSAGSNEMHTVFFGGIAQFYDSLGILVQDNNVPFVRTIARVTRNADGVMAEYKLPVEMPALLGASAEFIPLENLPSYSNEVVKLDDLSADTTLVGYVYGGIASTEANIFWVNTGTESVASSQIFKVFVVKNASSASHELNTQSTGSLQMQVFPNPNNGVFGVKFQLRTSTRVWLSISDLNGKLIDREELKNLFPGENIVTRKLPRINVGNAYFVTLETRTEKATVKTMIQE